MCLVQAPTPEIKTAWVNEIRKVLTQQLQACRGTADTPRASRACLHDFRSPASNWSRLLYILDASQQKSSDPVSPSPTSNNTSVSLRFVSGLVKHFASMRSAHRRDACVLVQLCFLPPVPFAAAGRKTRRSRRRRRWRRARSPKSTPPRLRRNTKVNV